MKKFAALLSILFLGLLFIYPLTGAFAEDAAPAPVDTVAGCNAVTVDPGMTLEEQQAICDQAEAKSASSCAAAGKGKCSAPKTNDMNVGGHNCLCLDTTTEVPAVETAPTEPPPPTS